MLHKQRKLKSQHPRKSCKFRARKFSQNHLSAVGHWQPDCNVYTTCQALQVVVFHLALRATLVVRCLFSAKAPLGEWLTAKEEENSITHKHIYYHRARLSHKLMRFLCSMCGDLAYGTHTANCRLLARVGEGGQLMHKLEIWWNLIFRWFRKDEFRIQISSWGKHSSPTTSEQTLLLRAGLVKGTGSLIDFELVFAHVWPIFRQHPGCRSSWCCAEKREKRCSPPPSWCLPPPPTRPRKRREVMVQNARFEEKLFLRQLIDSIGRW